MVRRVMLVLLMMLMAAAMAMPVFAAPGIAVQTTRRGPGDVPVFAPAIFSRGGVPQPPVAVPGQYFIVTGEGFPPNTPVTAILNDGTKNIPLAPVDLLALTAPPTAPATDTTGAIAGAAFQVPPPSQLAGRSGTLAVSAGPGAVAGVPIVVDVPLPNETAGDGLVVAAAAAFYLAAALATLFLIRRVPRPPRVAALREATGTGNAA